MVEIGLICIDSSRAFTSRGLAFTFGVKFKITPGGPLLVRHGIKTMIYTWPYTWVTGVMTRTSGVIALLIAGRGPNCIHNIL